jgi:hypothetical protein
MITVRKLVVLAMCVVGQALVTSEAHAVPAFARKYGMKCTACHEAWPVLNEFGRAFRDNGFRFNTGRDDEVLTDPAYWPIFSWNWTGYQANQTSYGGHATDKNGGTIIGLWSIGAYVNLYDHLSIRVFAPLVVGSGTANVIGLVGWVRYNRAFNTDWVNVKVGSVEQDMPIAGAREVTENGVGKTIWSYALPGDKSSYTLESAPLGVEITGHDLGSRTRYSVTVFSNSGPESTHDDFWSTPSIFGHLSREFQLTSGPIRQIEAGVFGSLATWQAGTGPYLSKQRRIGGHLDEWLISDAFPLHLTETYEHGKDDADLFAGGTQPGTFNGYGLQAIYPLSLPVALFGRAQYDRISQHAIPGEPSAFGDQDLYLIGVKYTYKFTTRFEIAIEPSYGIRLNKAAAPDGGTLKTQQFYMPFEFAF